MTRAIGGLASFVNGMADGYGTVMKFRQADEDAKDRAEDREYVRSQRARTAREQADADRLAGDVKAAAAPVTVDPVAEKPETMDNRDVGQPGEAPVSMSGFAVKGVKFDDQGKAQRTADEANASSAVYDRVADAYKKAGRLDLYESHKRMATQARDEGASDFADAVRAGSPSLAEIQASKAGFVSQELSPDAIKNFNGMGKWKLPADAVVQAFVSKDATGADVVDHRLVRPDGAMLVGSLNEATNFLGLDANQRRAARKDDQRLGLDVKRTDATIAHQAGTLKLQERQADENATYHRGMLSVAQQNANTTENYRRDQLALGRDKLKGEGGGAGQITVKDLRDFDHDLLSALGPQFAVKEGTTPEERTQLTSQLTAVRAQAQGIFKANAQVGQVLPASVVLQAHQMGQDPKQRRVVEVGGQQFPAVLVNGSSVIIGPAASPDATAATQAPRASSVAATAAGGVPLPWQANAQPAPGAAQPQAAPLSALDQAFGQGSISAQNVVGVAGAFKKMQGDLKTAIANKASAQELSQHAAAVEASRNALLQQLKDLTPQSRAQVLKSLGIDA